MERQVSISNAVTKNFGQQIAFLRRLIMAKSANPFTPETSSPDTPVEKEVASVIHQELHRLAFRAESMGYTLQRPNVVSILPGSGKSEKTLVHTTHMDTVEPSDYTRDPWGAEIEAGRLYGVGAAGAKAQIAAIVFAVLALREVGISPADTLILAFVVDEEPGACSRYGTHYLLEQGILRGDAAIIGEPGNRRIATGHRGLYRFRLQTLGNSTHTGRKAWEERSEGHNAILDMARIALALSARSLPDIPSEAFPDRKSVLTFPTLIRGGSGINVVPSSREAYGDVRLLPGLTAERVKELIKDELQKLSIDAYRLDDLLVVPPAETNPRAEIVQALASAAETITGVRRRLEGSGPACDGWMLIAKGIPTVCGYGVTCGGIHGSDEWVDLESLRRVTEVYAHTVLTYLGI